MSLRDKFYYLDPGVKMHPTKTFVFAGTPRPRMTRENNYAAPSNGGFFTGCGGCGAVFDRCMNCRPVSFFLSTCFIGLIKTPPGLGAVGGSKLSKNSVLIQYIRNPPTRVGANLREALRPRNGNQPMRVYYGI